VTKLPSENSSLSTPGMHRKTYKNRAVVDDFDLCVIRNIVNEFYVSQKKAPTLQKVLPVVKERLPNFVWGMKVLRRCFKECG